MDKEEKLLIIGSYCKIFRSESLGLTLQDFEKLSGVKVKTISSFENGKSTNILHVLKYIDLCDSDEQRTQFLKGLNAILGGINGTSENR